MKKPMSFSEALLKALDGEQITRPDWDSGTYGFFMDGILKLRMNFKYHNWILSEADVIASDWELA
jgi:hypothetical protein